MNGGVQAAASLPCHPRITSCSLLQQELGGIPWICNLQGLSGNTVLLQELVPWQTESGQPPQPRTIKWKTNNWIFIIFFSSHPSCWNFFLFLNQTDSSGGIKLWTALEMCLLIRFLCFAVSDWWMSRKIQCLQHSPMSTIPERSILWNLPPDNFPCGNPSEEGCYLSQWWSLKLQDQE